jgi:hypothetical protein
MAVGRCFDPQKLRVKVPILGDHDSYIAGLPMALERTVDPDKLRVKDGISLHFQMTSSLVFALICNAIETAVDPKKLRLC